MKARAIILFIVVGILSLGFIKPTDKFFAIARSLDVFATLIKELDRHYVDSIDMRILTRHAINGMLETYDPYTHFIPEEELEEFRTSTTGEYAGIGAQISQIDSGIYISMIYEGFAADRAGLKIGDQLVKINDNPLFTSSVSQVSAHLRGKPYSQVQMKILRTNSHDTLSFDVKREKISVNNVSYYGLVENHIGYIYLEEFTTGAAKEVREALKNLKSLGAQSIILDLRDNPGGLLSEAVNVCNIFIDKNKLIVETKGRRAEWNRSYKTLNKSADDKIPLAVLINSESASAAEIVAGVMQDYDRGILIGEKTFGKGLVQTTRSVSYGNQVKITTAKYYIPSGRCIQSIDYSQTNKETDLVGDGGKVNDGYKTRIGRPVQDGAGLRPDILIKDEEYSSITQYLISEGILFKYCRQLAESSVGSNINISDQEFDSFLSWLNQINYNVSFDFKEAVVSLMEAAQKEKNYMQLRSEIDLLRNKVGRVGVQQLQAYKKEIMQALNIERHVHLYGMGGGIKKRVQYDKTVEQALISLKDARNYKLVLSKQ